MVKALSVIGFLLYAAVMTLPLQGLSVLGGGRSAVGVVVMLKFHPIAFVVSTAVALALLVMTFIASSRLKLVGSLLSVVFSVGVVAFVLYLERGFNLLHAGWILSGLLLATGNWFARR